RPARPTAILPASTLARSFCSRVRVMVAGGGPAPRGAGPPPGQQAGAAGPGSAARPGQLGGRVGSGRPAALAARLVAQVQHVGVAETGEGVLAGAAEEVEPAVVLDQPEPGPCDAGAGVRHRLR